MRRLLVLIATVACVWVVVPASPAVAEPPTWSIVPSPNPLFDATRFMDVDCASSTSCLAVGYHITYSSNRQVLVAATWDGNTWSRITPAAPTGQFATFRSVSCADGVCVAVGDVGTPQGIAPLAESYVDGTWTILPTVSPTYGGFFTAVSCSSATVCTAMGWSRQNGAAELLLTERWSGGTWSIQSTPALPGAGYQFDGAIGLSCPSDTFCMAASATTSAAFAERWNGTTWTLVPAPQPGGQYATFSGVDCVSAVRCQLVGQRNDAQSSGLLAEGWDGTSLTVEDVPGVPPTGGQTLRTVSCVSATQCRAAGYPTVAYRFVNGVWSQSQIASPQPYMEIEGLSCSSTVSCQGVGWSYLNGVASTIPPTVADAFSLASEVWQPHAVIAPADYSPTGLTAVSCATSTDCSATGQAGTVQSIPTAMNWDGTAWTLTGASWPGSVYGTVYADVACSAAPAGDQCVVVGTQLRHEVPYHPLYGFRTGTGYDPTAALRPSRAQGALLGTSCAPDTAFCAAVGYLRGTTRQPFIDTYNGVHWTQNAPVDPGNGSLSAVSCSSASFCLAIGTQGSDAQPLAEQWDGTSWTLVATPIGATALTDISCTSSTTCTAIGTTGTGNGLLIATWDGTSWTTQPVTLPPSVTSASLAGVSCVATCWAVGQAQNSTGTHPFGVRPLSGGWTGRLLPQPVGASTASLADVSCVSTSDCTAVGSSTVNGVIASLVERFH